MLTKEQQGRIRSGDEITRRGIDQLARFYELRKKSARGLTHDERVEYAKLRVRRMSIAIRG